MLYNQILSERQKIEDRLRNIQEKIKELPDGKFICTHSGNHSKWYQSDGHVLTYIPKKNRKLAEQLAVRKYLTGLEQKLLHEKMAIDFYLRHHDREYENPDQILPDTQEFSELLSDYFSPQSQELQDWMNSPYEHNTKNPEQLIHRSISGNIVRSKSEALIDMLLHVNRIPFRYECALPLGDTVIFPDFTIRHPKTGKTYYWEHFGMMDNAVYCKKAFLKLQLYASNGIFPSIHLLTTYETMEHPLDSELVEEMIKLYFLKK